MSVEQTIIEKSKPSISARLVDMHSRGCVNCEKRRKVMETLYKIDKMTPEEWVARDKLFEQLYTECCNCILNVDIK